MSLNINRPTYYFNSYKLLDRFTSGDVHFSYSIITTHLYRLKTYYIIEKCYLKKIWIFYDILLTLRTSVSAYQENQFTRRLKINAEAEL